MLVEHALDSLKATQTIITTPVGASYQGVIAPEKICGISVLRAGECMEKPLREVCQSCSIGKILIQRDEQTALPELYYHRLPRDIKESTVLLCDPMLATGGTACSAINVAIEAGAPEGIKFIRKKYIKIPIITAALEQGLNDQAYILPGCGDFGDRYFGTVKTK